MSKRVLVTAIGDEGHSGRVELMYLCPACNRRHGLPDADQRRVHILVAGPGMQHEWNGDLERPTISGMVRIIERAQDDGGAPEYVCAAELTDGRLHFPADASHKLAGQTVDLPAIAD